MSHPKDPKRRRQNQKKNKRTQKSDLDENLIKNEERRAVRRYSALGRNFTWTVDPETKRCGPIKFLHHQEKARNDLSYFNCAKLPV